MRLRLSDDPCRRSAALNPWAALLMLIVVSLASLDVYPVAAQDRGSRVPAIDRELGRQVEVADGELANDGSGPDLMAGEDALPDEISPEEAASDVGPDVAATGEPSAEVPTLDLFRLLLKGGWLMVPIALMSLAVGTIVIERLFALRRARVLPPDLVDGLSDLDGVPGVMDPRRAYRLCQENPSAAAMVIRSMLLKIGRPQSEVEHAVSEASNREAERLYGSARWLTLIAAVAPLTGLLGTVWGMIRAFYDTTHLAAGQNKADFLAEGIYVALVTTLGGLVVAIPAAVAAHYFEGKVVAWFHEIDELLFNLLPQVERYEGRMRVTPHSLGSSDEEVARTAAADPNSRNPAVR